MKQRLATPRQISTRDALIYIAGASFGVGGYLLYRFVFNDGKDNDLLFVAFIAGGVVLCVALPAFLDHMSSKHKKEQEQAPNK